MSAYRQLLDEVREAGATVTLTGGGHWKIEKNGQTVYAPQTPSDHRSIDNVKAKLRRAGLLPRKSKLRLQPDEVEFLRRFNEAETLKGEGAVPARLEDRQLIRVSNRYKHGRLLGWQAWITPAGRRALEANE